MSTPLLQVINNYNKVVTPTQLQKRSQHNDFNVFFTLFPYEKYTLEDSTTPFMRNMREMTRTTSSVMRIPLPDKQQKPILLP